MSKTLPGPGDPETWLPYTGHSHDPRNPGEPEISAEELLDEWIMGDAAAVEVMTKALMPEEFPDEWDAILVAVRERKPEVAGRLLSDLIWRLAENPDAQDQFFEFTRMEGF